MKERLAQSISDAKFQDPPHLRLSDLLHPTWLNALGPVIAAQEEAHKYLGPKRSSQYLPAREHTFRALNALPPWEWKVVVFGQDPYPRADSANGFACMHYHGSLGGSMDRLLRVVFDNRITQWSDPMSPSFRNIIKNALIHGKHLKPDSKVDEMRSVWLLENKLAAAASAATNGSHSQALRRLRILRPHDWFAHTVQEGHV